MSWSTPRNTSTRPATRAAWRALCWSVGNDSTSSPAVATSVARERDDASYSVIKMVSHGHRERRRGEKRVGAVMWAIATSSSTSAATVAKSPLKSFEWSFDRFFIVMGTISGL